MIGIVLVSHGNVAKSMREAAEMILGEQNKIQTITLMPNDDIEMFGNRIKEAIRLVKSEEGVLILADLFGGSPCNAAAIILDEETKLVSGLNLPMLIEVLSARMYEDNLKVNLILEAAKDGIVYVNDFLR